MTGVFKSLIISVFHEISAFPTEQEILFIRTGNLFKIAYPGDRYYEFRVFCQSLRRWRYGRIKYNVIATAIFCRWETLWPHDGRAGLKASRKSIREEHVSFGYARPLSPAELHYLRQAFADQRRLRYAKILVVAIGWFVACSKLGRTIWETRPDLVVLSLIVGSVPLIVCAGWVLRNSWRTTRVTADFLFGFLFVPSVFAGWLSWDGPSFFIPQFYIDGELIEIPPRWDQSEGAMLARQKRCRAGLPGHWYNTLTRSPGEFRRFRIALSRRLYGVVAPWHQVIEVDNGLSIDFEHANGVVAPPPLSDWVFLPMWFTGVAAAVSVFMMVLAFFDAGGVREDAIFPYAVAGGIICVPLFLAAARSAFLHRRRRRKFEKDVKALYEKAGVAFVP
jgi:hypothetical protein